MSLTLCTVVRNEAHRLRSFLVDVKDHVDEIVIVDQSSNDATVELAHDFFDQYGVPGSIIIDDARGYCEASRALADRNAHSEWRLILDADENMSPWFKMNVRHMIADERLFGSYRVKRAHYIDGEMRFEGDAQLRLHRRDCVKFLDELHTDPQPEGPRKCGKPPDIICIEHHKTLTEQLDDELRYENIIFNSNKDDEWKSARLKLNVYLAQVREKASDEIAKYTFAKLKEERDAASRQ